MIGTVLELATLNVIVICIGFGIIKAIRSLKIVEKGKLTEAEIGIIAGLVEKRIRDNIK